MLEEKILPITAKGSVTSYAHWAYPMAILEQGLQETKTNVLNLELLPEEKTKEWHFNTRGIEEEVQFPLFVYKADKWAGEREFFKYRELSEIDQLIVKIEDMRYDSANTIFNILIGDLVSNKQSIQVAIMCKRGIHLAYNGKAYESPCNFQLKFPLWFKVERVHEKVCALLSVDGIYWDSLMEVVLLQTDIPHIGYNLNSYDDQIMNWKYSNFIQLKLNRDINVYFDYFIVPKRDVRYHYLNNFLEATYSCKKDIIDLFDTLGAACKWNLLRKRYCLLWLDEFYLRGRESYEIDHYRHPNMIYGFSGNEFLIMGYSPSGKLIKTREKTEIIERAYCSESDDSPFETLFYNPNDCEYIFDEECILEQIKEYALGINSSKRMSSIISKENAVYGLETYEYILAGKFISRDLRVPYLIYEHNKIMEERLLFLQAKNKKYKSKEFKIQIGLFHKIVEKSKRILWMAIKNSMQPCYENEIEKRFKELIHAERAFYTKFLELSKRIRDSDNIK